MYLLACESIGKKSIDEKKFVGVVKMDISKSFDSIPHELLISNVNVYELRMDVVAHYSLLLKRRNQNARIDNTVVLRSTSFISWATVMQYIY